MDALDKYIEVFCNTFDVTDNDLNEEFTFHNISKWDSVAHLTLISNLEDTFDVLFDADDILNFGSYLNGIEILKRYGVEFK